MTKRVVHRYNGWRFWRHKSSPLFSWRVEKKRGEWWIIGPCNMAAARRWIDVRQGFEGIVALQANLAREKR